MELLYSPGLRRAEVAALDLTDVDLAGGVVFVRSGKGGKSCLVPLGDRAADVERRYVEKERPRCSGAALFVASERSGAAGRRLAPASIEDRVERAAEKARIGRVVTPHAFRHGPATHLLRAGAGLRHVQAILGHARIDTTEAYTHLDLKDLAAAHARSHPRGRATNSRLHFTHS